MSPNALETAAQNFLSETARNSSPATTRQLRFVLERVWLPWCAEAGVFGLDQVGLETLNRFTDQLSSRGKPLSIHSVATYVRNVRWFLKWAKASPEGYRPPREPERLLETLSRDEIDALEAAATDERDRLIVRVLADTGVRLSELLGLRQVDLRENRRDRQYGIRVIGKGDREREVPVPAKTFARLRHYAEHGGIRGDYIFMGRRRRAGQAQRLTKSGVDQLLHNLATEAEINRRVYAHLFRHSYITHAMSSGKVDSVTLQKIVGHKSLAMISQRYTHLVLGDKYRAILGVFD